MSANSEIIKDIKHSPSTRGPEKNHPAKLSPVLKPALIVLSLLLFICISYNVGIALFRNQYNSLKENTSDAVRETTYKAAYNSAENNYHVTNRVSLSIGDLQEMSDLEVLQVSDVEYETVSSKDNPEKIDSWLEVPGYGIYTVDLSMCEFVIDNEHQHILVRLPAPVLTTFGIDYSNVKRLLYKNAGWDDSISVGEELAKNLLQSAYTHLKTELAKNQLFFKSAKNSAKVLVTNLLTSLNPEATDLKVEIEFIN